MGNLGFLLRGSARSSPARPTSRRGRAGAGWVNRVSGAVIAAFGLVALAGLIQVRT